VVRMLKSMVGTLVLVPFLLACPASGGGGSNDTGTVIDAANDVNSPTDEGATDSALSDVQGTDQGTVADTGTDTGTSPEPNGEACPLENRVGYFEVAHWEFYASVAGHVTNGVVPLEILQAKEQVGDCVLMRKENPFCDPPCGAGQLCNHDGTCLDYPENQPLGTVTVDGLLTDVTMEPSITNAYAETDVPFPMFENNSKVTLKASGGDVDAFTLHGYGVEELAVDATILTLVKGEDLTVTWTASEGKGNLYMRLNVDQHGNSPVTMICDVADTGEAVLPGSILKILLEYGVSGFATFDIYRRTIDSTWMDDRCVELRTFSFTAGKVIVDGHVPCFSDADCPDGETCKVEINTCVGG
jgi:hypothetical protein